MDRVVTSPRSHSKMLDLRSMPELVVVVTAIYCAVHVAKNPLPFLGECEPLRFEGGLLVIDSAWL